ncbi:hypothetical protein JCM17844_22600 [Iodidimonas gelatinilytica]|uniref:DUF2794 domain-containing protein n=1 Tax=Iodidimonas gelatinilytica TaxID=1236966 RepID=A0A5A7MTL1_9PROT|nr:DUF2794 domain-containing protein [Iodidimonas gelatinilytica]GEQ98623.1 hypothetical protein JCM17844_22600 [Iodidimonas gelatinilytica]
MVNHNLIAPFPSTSNAPKAVLFTRMELTLILNVYGRMVAAGNWRDYGIHSGRDRAVFSIFRRASEMPLYRIIKSPAHAKRQGAWLILGMDGQILKRGQALGPVLKLFERQLLKLAN